MCGVWVGGCVLSLRVVTRWVWSVLVIGELVLGGGYPLLYGVGMTTTESPRTCPICTKPEAEPYRHYNVAGELTEGCVSAFHGVVPPAPLSAVFSVVEVSSSSPVRGARAWSVVDEHGRTDCAWVREDFAFRAALAYERGCPFGSLPSVDVLGWVS